MKTTLTIAAAAIVAALTVSCGNKKKTDTPIGYESYSEDVYMPNDSTIEDWQTYTYEGMLPTDEGIPANYVLIIDSYGLNSDGVYSLTESYTETNGMSHTNYDEGDMMILIGMPNDSTAIVYELISYGSRPRLRLAAEGDSALYKVDKDFKRASHDAKHKLHRKHVKTEKQK